MGRMRHSWHSYFAYFLSADPDNYREDRPNDASPNTVRSRTQHTPWIPPLDAADAYDPRPAVYRPLVGKMDETSGMS